MTLDDQHLERLGVRLAKALAAQDRLHEAEAAGIRQRLLVAPKPQRGVLLGFACAAAVVGVLFLTRVWFTPALAFSVDGSPATDSRAFLNAPADRPMDLDFSDGTRLRVGPGSGARIVDLQNTGAVLVLERGTLHANVRHGPRTSWAVTAGPFLVNVVGTEFDVVWDPAPGLLTVVVARGRVLVSGGGVQPHAVGAGNTLTAHAVRDGANFEVHPSVSSASGTPGTTQVEAATRATASSAAAETTEPSPAAVASAPEAARPSEPQRAASNEWRELAKHGRYREAMAATDSEGFQAQLASASAADLMTLGNTARLAGSLARAEEAFLTLRQRFPHDSSRPVAAFSLGKIAFDQKNDPRSAARWFRACLQEAPSGSLARESEGRLLESLQRVGDRTGARNVAREYLNRYPDGPHANLARDALSAGE